MISKAKRMEYIASVQEAVEQYCSTPQGKATMRNRLAEEIDAAIKKLAQWRMWEEVAEILQQLSDVWEDLPGNGVCYSTWLDIAVRNLQPEGACWLFREHRELFLTWLYDVGGSEQSIELMLANMDANRWDEHAEKSQEVKDFKRFAVRNRKKAASVQEAADKRRKEALQEQARVQAEYKAARQAVKERREKRAKEREQLREEAAGREQTAGTAVSIPDETQSALAFLKDNGIDLPKPFSKELRLLNTRINGSRYVENIYSLAKSLKEGDAVKLVLEPDNPYDARAIRVDTAGGDKLGYVPRRVNEILHNLMKAGKHVYGVVADGDVGAALGRELPPEQIEIYIDVYMTD